MTQSVAAKARLPLQLPVGLSSDAAERLLEEFGPNRLPDPPPRSLASRVGEQVRDPMILLLLAAATLTSILRDWPSTAVIGAVVVFNTSAGVVQQVRAERAMSELRRLVAPVANVCRDGEFLEVPAAGIVPGDVVRIVAGDVVPADGEILDARDVQVNEAHITGEALPVDLVDGEATTGGTLVTRGHALVRVTRTGADSGIGRIAALLADGKRRATPLQRRLARLSRTLVVAVGLLTSVVVAIGLANGRPVPEMLVVGLSLAVAAVPESLPAVVTVALAMGAHRMAVRNAVVSSLPAVETLGSVTVVATDKTGTLTEGTMFAERLWTPSGRYVVEGSGYAPSGTILADSDVLEPGSHVDRLLRDVVLCNDAEIHLRDGEYAVAGDPLEGALLALAAKKGHTPEILATSWPRIGEHPFDHQLRRMMTTHDGPRGRVLTVCKGAPEAVLALVSQDATAAAAAQAANHLAGQGYRVIAVADDEVDAEPRTLELVGLVAIGDPPREQAAAVVTSLKEAGVGVVLVTGDHAGTAEAIARRVGIAGPDDRAVEGGQIAADGVPSDAALKVIARVQPEQKVHVVDALQARGEIVAMLGDGVNDAPALRRADIGVAAGRGGTEVAKQAADLVLLDDDLGTVVSAVREGRRIFANIRAFLTYAISGGLAEVGVMLLGPTVGLALPLLPAQILWINLVTHGLTGVAFGAEPADPKDMAQPPRPPSESIFTAQARTRLLVATVVLTASSLLAAAWATSGIADRRTAIFITLGLGQLGVALALRASGRRRLRERGLELAVLAAAGLQLAAAYFPWFQDLLGTTALPAPALAIVGGAAAVPWLAVRLAVRWL